MKLSNLKKGYSSLTAILGDSAGFVSFSFRLTEGILTTK